MLKTSQNNFSILSNKTRFESEQKSFKHKFATRLKMRENDVKLHNLITRLDNKPSGAGVYYP